MSSEPRTHPEPRVTNFETFVRVRFHETDALGHVNNAAYLNYLEQAAIDHATYLGLDMQRLQALGGIFLARRHEITFVRPSYAGDTLRVLTWLDAPSGARIVRNYRILREAEPPEAIPTLGRLLDGQVVIDEAAQSVVVRATTEWVFANEQGMPRRIPREIEDLFR